MAEKHRERISISDAWHQAYKSLPNVELSLFDEFTDSSDWEYEYGSKIVFSTYRNSLSLGVGTKRKQFKLTSGNLRSSYDISAFIAKFRQFIDEYDPNPFPDPVLGHEPGLESKPQTAVNQLNTLYSDPHTSPLKPALHLRSSAPQVFFTSSKTKTVKNFVGLCKQTIAEISEKHEHVIVSCIMRKKYLKELIYQIEQETNLLKNKVTT